MELHVAQADITTLAVDGIVVPSNSQGSMDDGIRREIRDRGGEHIEAAIRSKAPVAVGAAVLAEGGLLTSENVILVPIVQEPGSIVPTESIKRATKAALIAANVRRLKTLGIPLMLEHRPSPKLTSRGAGPSIAEATRALVQEIHAHKGAFPETIYLVDKSAEVTAVFEDTVRDLERGS